jgi:hypothetical protein
MKINTAQLNNMPARKNTPPAESGAFAQMLKNSTQSEPYQKIETQPATLVRSTLPRLPQELKSLYATDERPAPQPSGLETTGSTRLSPPALSTRQ